MIDLPPKGVRGSGPLAIAFDARKLGKGPYRSLRALKIAKNRLAI
jgi:hypothetical protein